MCFAASPSSKSRSSESIIFSAAKISAIRRDLSRVQVRKATINPSWSTIPFWRAKSPINKSRFVASLLSMNDLRPLPSDCGGRFWHFRMIHARGGVGSGHAGATTIPRSNRDTFRFFTS